MELIAFLDHLRSLGIRLWAEGDRLRFSAPQGALTADLRDQLAARREEVLAFFRLAEAATQSALPPLRRAERGAALPLSFAQQRLWFFDQLQPGNPLYNITYAFTLTGRCDLTALQSSLNRIVQRHESLRTTFLPGPDGQPVQVIAAQMSIPLAVVAVEGPGEWQAEARRLAALEAQKPFDLTRGPLLRATLLRVDAQTHILLLVIHHIVFDGWSRGVFFRELAEFYPVFAGPASEAGAASEIPELQYADYTLWQREWLQGPALEDHLAYWKEKLGLNPPALQMPTDRPRPALQTFQGATHSFELPPNLLAGLKTLSRQEGATLFMTLLAGFQALLHRYTGQAEILVGTPVHGRSRSELEGLIGFFVNTLVLRADVAAEMTFRDLLQQVRQTALEAYAHQDIPFEKLVETLQPRRDLSRMPLFQVMLVLQNTPQEALQLPDLVISPWEVHSGTARFDLTLVLTEMNEGLKGVFEFSTTLFDPATIQRLAGHLVTLLHGAVANPAETVARLPLLNPAEKRLLLEEWSCGEQQPLPPGTVEQLFSAQAQRSPQAPAVRWAGGELSYAELEAAANRLANYLRGLGVGVEERVGLCLDRGPEMVVAMLAILKAGAAFVPLDPAYPVERLNFMLSDSQAGLLVTQPGLLIGSSLPDIPTLFLEGAEEHIRREPSSPPENGAGPDSLAYIIYTSGSTGRPKGVEVTRRGLPNLCQAQRELFTLGAGSRMLQFASLSFDAAVWEVFLTLLAGATLVLAPRHELLPGPPLAATLKREGITVVTLPPSILAVLNENEFPELQTVISAGEPCTEPLRQRWSQGRRFVNAYGPTETTVCATAAVYPPVDRPLSIGRPILNTRVYILDGLLQPAPIGVPGELYISGISLARGYMNRPELTAGRFITNPYNDEANPGESEKRLYKTGDLARWLPNGEIEYLGRIDLQVKLRGFRIELEEIEAVLMAHPGVQAAVVTLVGSEAAQPGEQRLVAYLTPAGPTPPDRDELRRFLKQKLPDYMLPAAFVALESLPLTPAGKIDRRALPAPQASPAVQPAFVPPATATQQALAAIWGELLKLDRVSLTTDFFEAGGHSLLATRLVTRLQAELGVSLPLPLLFEATTLAALAEQIENVRWVSREAGAHPAGEALEREEIDL